LLNFQNDIMSADYKIYETFKVFKGPQSQQIIDQNLTEDEANELVQKDILINPDCEEYMLCRRKMSAFREPVTLKNR